MKKLTAEWLSSYPGGWDVLTLAEPSGNPIMGWMRNGAVSEDFWMGDSIIPPVLYSIEEFDREEIADHVDSFGVEYRELKIILSAPLKDSVELMAEYMSRLDKRDDAKFAEEDPTDWRFRGIKIYNTDDGSEYGELLSHAETLANEVFITANCCPNWDNIRKMKSLGYDVGPGEKDSFGWLTGVVTDRKNKKALVFG